MIRTLLGVAMLCCAVIFTEMPAAAQGRIRKGPPVDQITVEGLKDLLWRDSGKVHIVNVWATWCIPCRAELPGLLRLRREFDSSGVKLILISTDDPAIVPSVVLPLLDSLGVDFRSYIDRDSSEEAFINGMSAAWGGALPATFFYDRQGRQDTMFVGGKSYDQFKSALLPLVRANR